MSQAWTVGAVAEAVGGRLEGDAHAPISGFTTDSREVAAGDLFVGIVGERVDGGTLAADAAASGAVGSIISTAAAASGAGGESVASLIVVDDPTEALARLGIAARRMFNGRVIGITGSAGKTSTKDILGSILRGSGKTFVSAGNRNTEIGMPLEMLRVPDDTDSVVLEMAMRGGGQIAELARIAEPDAGIVVNIGPAHIEILGSLERIAAAKAELIGGLKPGSVCVVPEGEALLKPYLRDDLDTVTFGPAGDCRLVAAEGRDLTIDFRGSSFNVTVDFDQPHNRLNLLAAVGAVKALGLDVPSELSVDFSGLRGQRKSLKRDVVVIDDCYNANPMSMRAALADLSGESERRGGRRVAVLGDMLELGTDSASYHRQLGVDAAAAGVDLLVTVGPMAAEAGLEFGGRHVETASADEATEALLGALADGDTVLVKASRGIGLEVVAQRLEGEWS